MMYLSSPMEWKYALELCSHEFKQELNTALLSRFAAGEIDAQRVILPANATHDLLAELSAAVRLALPFDTQQAFSDRIVSILDRFCPIDCKLLVRHQGRDPSKLQLRRQIEASRLYCFLSSPSCSVLECQRVAGRTCRKFRFTHCCS